MLGVMWAYRIYILRSIINGISFQLNGSFVGWFWAIFSPLIFASLYGVILSEVLSLKLDGLIHKASYAAYLMSGILFWSLFSEILNRLSTAYISKANQIKKTNFPKITIIVSEVSISLINNLILTICVIFVLWYLDWQQWKDIYWLVVAVASAAVLAVPIGVVLAVFAVFDRSITITITTFLQVMFWLTPIVYPIKIVPEGFRNMLEMNPLLPIIEVYRYAFFGDDFEIKNSFYLTSGFLFLVIMFLLLIYKNASRDMMDEL